MKKILGSLKKLPASVISGIFFFLIIFVSIQFIVRYAAQKRLHRQQYFLVKEAISHKLTSENRYSALITTSIENALKQYPDLSQDYQGSLAHLHLVQGNEEQAETLLENIPSSSTLTSLLSQIIAVNNEITRLYLKNDLENALQQAKNLQTLLNNHKNNFPNLYSLNSFRLFTITDKMNLEEKQIYAKEINDTSASHQIFALFSEGNYSIRNFLNI